jgi:hypothetical protein
MAPTETIVVGPSTVTHTSTQSPPIQLSIRPQDLRNQWRRCGLTANFLANTPFISAPTVVSVVSTVVNEILENAIKFSESDTTPIQIQVSFTPDSIECEVMNWAKIADANNLSSYFQTLKTANIEDLYFLQLEKSATTTSNESHIGLVGVLHDYPVSLGCEIQGNDDSNSPRKVSIKAKINLNEVPY